ncbi:MAG: type I-E CRISPR-associated protein Cse2/CasB [gamma proteobacterium endosymbiont of Lamellibrachia anaximandri]|nr:type I-E CRISPR-associated protein Cse2/CasB [gamma proteobacterium endosymbiont of Lamellibrachia anaximandri]MBL3533843.1 type I-E CRISPR-associated protein Cse2/CasB [gamma proteobacterium endosymbiont of Lamellibrachia anaximandri]
MSKVFAPDGPGTGILTTWWQSLENDRGTRATLRRCNGPTQVMLHPAYIRLCKRLEPFLNSDHNWELRLARVVGLLSHCRHTTARDLARAMAGDGKPVVSELRFRRLLQEKPDDLYLAMIRILHMLGHTANLPDLISSVYYWGDSVRKRWAFAYFPFVPETKTA